MLEYELIKKYYEYKVAKRSGIPYINHIDEGLLLLNYKLRAKDSVSHRAFCLHPFYQDNIRIDTTKISGHSTRVAYFYSIIANTFLRHNYKNNNDLSHWIPSYHSVLCNDKSSNVYNMLYADKIQNYKDFMKHYNSYSEAESIEEYFLWWFDVLKITHRELNKALEIIS